MRFKQVYASLPDQPDAGTTLARSVSLAQRHTGNTPQDDFSTKKKRDLLSFLQIVEEGATAVPLRTARPSPSPSPCTQFTRAGIEWRRCHRAACMARSYQEHHRAVRAEP